MPCSSCPVPMIYIETDMRFLHCFLVFDVARRSLASTGIGRVQYVKSLTSERTKYVDVKSLTSIAENHRNGT
jgi:hypothetical protein